MANRKPLIDDDGEVRELARADFRRFKPFSSLSKDVREKLLSVRRRGPQKMPTKERITIRLSEEVLVPFRDSGDGWQTRMDAALADWLKTHSPKTGKRRPQRLAGV